jgi:hypothetical protein
VLRTVFYDNDSPIKTPAHPNNQLDIWGFEEHPSGSSPKDRRGSVTQADFLPLSLRKVENVEGYHGAGPTLGRDSVSSSPKAKLRSVIACSLIVIHAPEGIPNNEQLHRGPHMVPFTYNSYLEG